MLQNQFEVERAYKHTPYTWLPNDYQGYVRDYFSFTWVRHPFHRLASYWDYMNFRKKAFYEKVKGKMPREECKEKYQNIFQWLDEVPTFNSFIQALPQEKKDNPLEYYYFDRTMTYDIMDNQGNMMIDFIGHQETFGDDWQRLAPKIGYDAQDIMQEGVVNKEGRDLRNYFTSPELVDIAYNHFEEDFDNFGYEIPEELK